MRDTEDRERHIGASATLRGLSDGPSTTRAQSPELGAMPLSGIFSRGSSSSTPAGSSSSTPPAERRAGVKLTCSMGTLEEWSVGERVVDPSQPAPEPRAYCPGLVEVPGGRMLCTVDRLDGTAQLLVRVS